MHGGVAVFRDPEDLLDVDAILDSDPTTAEMTD
jgi:hypothetical protein